MSEQNLPKKSRPSGRGNSGLTVAKMSGPLDVNAPSIERHVIDRLLLAIIDGCPDTKDTLSATWQARRLKRLQDARKALFNDDSRSDSSDHEISALKMMSVWYRRDLQLQAMRQQDPRYLSEIKFTKPRSFRRLAREASIKLKGEAHEDFIEKLRKEFAKKSNYYLDLIYHTDETELMQEYHILDITLNHLSKLGIRFARPVI